MSSLPLTFKRLLLVTVASAGLAMTPAASTLAAPARAAAQITGFDMEPVDKVTAGGELFFRVTGTAGAQASVRVAGVARTIVLQEVDTGTYEGSYTIRPNDRVSPNSSATVNLRYKGRAATSTLGRLAVAQAAGAAATQAQQATQARPAATPFAINRFVARQIGRAEPGAEIRFLLEGSPGARASFNIENVVANVPMREASPGRYEGSYTIRRNDRIPANVSVVATLEANNQVVRANLGGSLFADAKPPVIGNVSPRDGEVVGTSGLVTVSGNFDKQGGSDIDTRSVRIVVGGRDVTAQSTITPENFSYRADLPPGNYAADVTAKDQAGNTARSAWSFSVRPGGVAGPAPTTLPLEITSHAPNAAVGAGRVEVRGRTAPGATVDVQVTGVASVGGFFGVNQALYSERLTADNAGNFIFGFAPPVRVPGMQYEVELKATSGNQTRDTKLVLQQQR